MEIGRQLTMLSQETKKIQPSNTLILKIGTRNFSFLLVKSSDNKIIDFYEHNYEYQLRESEISKELNIKLLNFLKNYNNISNVKLIINNRLSTLVPETLFDEKLSLEYLKYDVKLLKNDVPSYDKIDEIEAVNVYLPFINVNNYLIDNFGTFDYFHYSTLFIKKSIKYELGNNHYTCLNFRENCFDMAVLKNGKLLFHNSFDYKTKEDVLYFILNSFQQNKFKLKKNIFFISGNLNDDISDFLKKFHNNINFSDEKIDWKTENQYIDHIMLCE